MLTIKSRSEKRGENVMRWNNLKFLDGTLAIEPFFMIVRDEWFMTKVCVIASDLDLEVLLTRFPNLPQSNKAAKVFTQTWVGDDALFIVLNM